MNNFSIFLSIFTIASLSFSQLYFVGGSTLNDSNSLTLNCIFTSTSYNLRQHYICKAKDLELLYEDSMISDLIGQHESEKSNKNVEILLIFNQYVKFLPRNINTFFENLKVIDVQHTKLKRIEKNNFNGLDIEILNLGRNFLKTFDEDTLYDLRSLRKINLNHNKIEYLPNKFFSFNNQLEILSLENNNLKDLNETLLQNLDKLKKIFLRNNEISILKAQTFKNNKLLEKIDVSSNKLKFIDAELLNGLTMLKKIDFHGNSCLKDLDDDKEIEIVGTKEIFDKFCGVLEASDESIDESGLLEESSEDDLDAQQIEEIIEHHIQEKNDMLVEISKLKTKLKKLKTNSTKIEICNENETLTNELREKNDEHERNLNNFHKEITSLNASFEATIQNFKLDTEILEQKQIQLKNELFEAKQKMSLLLIENHNFEAKVITLKNENSKLRMDNNSEIKRRNDEIHKNFENKMQHCENDSERLRIINKGFDAQLTSIRNLCDAKIDHLKSINIKCKTELQCCEAQKNELTNNVEKSKHCEDCHLKLNDLKLNFDKLSKINDDLIERLQN